MFPNLQSTVLKEFGVSIQGFQAGSTKLILSGPSQSLDEPFIMITRILNGHSVTTETCFGLLIPSALKRISLEKLPAVLCASAENGKDFCYAKAFSNRASKIILSICGPDNALHKVKAILRSPKEKELSLVNTGVLQKLKESSGCNFPYLLRHCGVYILEHVRTTGCSLTVQGYVEEEVETAFSILSNAAAKLHCSSHPRMSHHPMVSSSISKPFFQKTYKYSKTIEYECHPKLKSQVQEYVIKPLQKQVSMGASISFLDSEKILLFDKSSESNSKNVITIMVKSSNSQDFSTACNKLKVYMI